MKVFYYINQLQFSIVMRSELSYDLLYFCLPAERFMEVCVIVILQCTCDINLFLFVLLCLECSFVRVVYIVCFSIMRQHKLWEQNI